jgi:hypothetical protein
MSLTIKLSEATNARKEVPISCVDATDNTTPETGLTFAAADIKVRKAGGTLSNSAGSVAEVGIGLYVYRPTAGELDTVGDFLVVVDKTGVAKSASTVQVVPYDPYSTTAVGILTPSALTAAILDEANTVRTGYSLRRLFRIIGSVLGGRLSGAKTGVETFRSLDDTTNEVTVTTDASGNRTAVTHA